MCRWSDCVTGECPKCPYGDKCYKGPKCPVVENDEGWLMCEMTGSVLDSQPRYVSSTLPDLTSQLDEEVHIPSDPELGSWLMRKSNDVTFLDVNTKLFEPLLIRKLNDLTRHLKMIIRTVIGCKQGHNKIEDEPISYFLLNPT